MITDLIFSIWDWIRYRTFDKRNIIKLPIKAGYHDIDEMMLHSCFVLLTRYVENGGLNSRIWGMSTRCYEIHQEIQALYEWWIKVEKGQFCCVDIDEENEMLCRLINIRHYIR